MDAKGIYNSYIKNLVLIDILKINLFKMQNFLISYEFNSTTDKIKGGAMLTEWYDSKGPEKRPSNYIVHSWVFMIQKGVGHSVVSSDSLETIWQQWNPWSHLMEISIEPCLDLDETVSLFKKIS